MPNAADRLQAIAARAQSVVEDLRRQKPRSARRALLEIRLQNLRFRQLELENRIDRKNRR